MTDNQHKRLRHLFDRAFEMPAAARLAFLHEQCGGDVILQQRVLAMLATEDELCLAPHRRGADDATIVGQRRRT